MGEEQTQLGLPEYFVLRAIQAMVAGGAREVRVETKPKVCVTGAGAAVTLEELEPALRAAALLNPTSVEARCQQVGRVDVLRQLRDQPEERKSEEVSSQTVRCTVTWTFPRPPNLAQVASRCRFASIPVWVDGQAANREGPAPWAQRSYVSGEPGVTLAGGSLGPKPGLKPTRVGADEGFFYDFVKERGEPGYLVVGKRRVPYCSSIHILGRGRGGGLICVQDGVALEPLPLPWKGVTIVVPVRGLTVEALQVKPDVKLERMRHDLEVKTRGFLRDLRRALVVPERPSSSSDEGGGNLGMWGVIGVVSAGLGCWLTQTWFFAPLLFLGVLDTTTVLQTTDGMDRVIDGLLAEPAPAESEPLLDWLADQARGGALAIVVDPDRIRAVHPAELRTLPDAPVWDWEGAVNKVLPSGHDVALGRKDGQVCLTFGPADHRELRERVLRTLAAHGG